MSVSSTPAKAPRPGGKKPVLKRRLVRTGVVLWAIALLGLLIFAEVIRPNQDARAYTQRLKTASKPLEQCFDKLAATTELQLYYAPDIPLAIKQSDLTTIRRQINDCRQELTDFSSSARTLMDLRFAGYTQTYRDAKVNQKQAYDVIGQSTDVMNQYDKFAAFLATYFTHIETYLGYTQALSELDTAVVTAANSRALASQAADLRARADAILKLDAPAEFDSTKQQTAKLFSDTATGIETVGRGYANYADFITSSGFEQVDAATKLYDSTIANAPFEQITASYIPKQVVQLPVKVENLLAAQSE